MAYQNIIMECRGCGAAVAIDPALRFASCPYCGNRNTLIQTDRAAEIPAVEEVYPAHFSERAFRSAVRAFLCTRPDVPDSLYESLSERELALNFIPFYRHDIDWSANWTADIGYDNENAKNGIAWQASGGQATGTARVYAPASSVIHNRGFGRVACDLAAANRNDPQHFDPGEFTGVSYLNCDVDAQAMEKQYVAPVLNAGIEAGCEEQLPGEYRKNMRCTGRADGRRTVLQMIPFWLFVYEWEGKTYFVMQNAASGAVDGTLPSSPRRKVIAALLTAAAAVLIALASWILWRLRGPCDALFALAWMLPLAACGMMYRDAVTRRKARIKLVPVAEIGNSFRKLQAFEKRFLTLAGAVMVGWIAAAVLLTLLMPVLLPKIWHDPVEPVAPDPPQQRMTMRSRGEQKRYIRLKIDKIADLSEEIRDDDGNVFVVEK